MESDENNVKSVSMFAAAKGTKAKRTTDILSRTNLAIPRISLNALGHSRDLALRHSSGQVRDGQLEFFISNGHSDL